MKLLFDQKISFRIEKKLGIPFSNSKHISSLGLSNAIDIGIWDYARTYFFTIVTFDSDFYDLSLLNGCPPKIIWIRTGNLTTVNLINLLQEKHLLTKNFTENPDKSNVACLELN